jgi:hypothetical protein
MVKKYDRGEVKMKEKKKNKEKRNVEVTGKHKWTKI